MMSKEQDVRDLFVLLRWWAISRLFTFNAILSVSLSTTGRHHLRSSMGDQLSRRLLLDH